MNDPNTIIQAHEAIEAAIAAASIDGLNVVGFGEITLAVAWPTEAPTIVLKRLPLFASRARFDAYAQLIEENMAALAARGVPHVPTELRSVPAAGGGVAGYLVQPYLPSDRLLPEVIRGGSDAQARAQLAQLIS